MKIMSDVRELILESERRIKALPPPQFDASYLEE